MEFKASMDKFTKITTVVVSLMLLSAIVLQFMVFKNNNFWIPLITSSFILVGFIITLLYKPNTYTIQSNQVIIHRFINEVVIKKFEIKSIKQIEKDELKGTIRTFGVGGLFGYFGKFYNSTFGAITWYATRRSNYILITTSTNKKIIITPDNPEDFVKEFYKS
jgi:ABC-type uncharacterized transport system permease subunit